MDKANLEHILFLNEKEAVKAGASDAQHCVDVMEEVFELLGQGDYLMGSPDNNARGIKIYFPEKSNFANMPTKGPDRRFMALVAYLGGRFNICGETWYGSNIENKKIGLPRAILITVLNDAKTGTPFAIISANALSATRTGAVPAVGAKYLANPDSEVLGVIGIGVIGKACVTSLMYVLKHIQTIKVYDIDPSNVKKYCKELEGSYSIKAIGVNSIEEAVRGSDVINVATSGPIKPEIKDEWLGEYSFLSLPVSAKLDVKTIKTSTILVDNWKMNESYAYELKSPAVHGRYQDKLEGANGFLLDLVEDKEIDPNLIINLGELVVLNDSLRDKDKKIESELIYKLKDFIIQHTNPNNIANRCVYIMDGMPIEDVAWGYEVYNNACTLDIGTHLNLWG